MKISTFGRCKTALHMEPAITSLTAPAHASTVFHPMGSTASQGQVIMLNFYWLCQQHLDGFSVDEESCIQANNAKNFSVNLASFSTVSSIIFEYELTIEVHTNGTDQLRSTIQNFTFPVQITPLVNLSEAAVTTGRNTHFGRQVL